MADYVPPQPFLGEIRLFGGSWEPKGWKFCNGQLLAITSNEGLFTLIGTTFGGDGTSTFALPDLRGRVPIGLGTGPTKSYKIGDAGGAERVSLTPDQLEPHNHQFYCTTADGDSNTPVGNLLATSGTITIYRGVLSSVQMDADSCSFAGQSTPHENMQPFLVINFIISMTGPIPPHQ